MARGDNRRGCRTGRGSTHVNLQHIHGQKARDTTRRFVKFEEERLRKEKIEDDAMAASMIESPRRTEEEQREFRAYIEQMIEVNRTQRAMADQAQMYSRAVRHLYGEVRSYGGQLVNNLIQARAAEMMNIRIGTAMHAAAEGETVEVRILDEAGWETILPVKYPNLTRRRRVVLDLAHSGYGPAAEIVENGGEILCILPPEAEFRPGQQVGGAVEHKGPLGPAVAKLLKAEASFDLIVTDVHCHDTTPREGFFAPSPKPLAKAGRRLLLAPEPELIGPVKPEPPLLMAIGVWRATHALLSDRGEALLRMHIADFNALVKSEGEELPTLWWADVSRMPCVDLYIVKSAKVTATIPERLTKAPKVPRGWLTGGSILQYTAEQRGKFERALCPRK